MKHLKLGLCKELEEKGKLKDIETEYVYAQCYIDRGDCPEWPIIDVIVFTKGEFKRRKEELGLIFICKAPTLEEALEILPRTHTSLKWDFRINITKSIELYRLTMYTVDFANERWAFDYISSVWTRLWIWQKTWKTQLEAVEKMLEYLLENNLI